MSSHTDTTPHLLSHRLRGFSKHEGSIEGLRAALDLNIAWVEIDTRKTADGQVLVFHDTRLDRITTASGLVRDYSVSTHGLPEYTDSKGKTVPTLGEFLREFAERRQATRLMLDIKDPGSEEAHIELLRRYGIEEHAWAIAWDPDILIRVHELAPELALGFSHVPLTRHLPLLRTIARLAGDGTMIRWAGRALARLRLDYNTQDTHIYLDKYNPESRSPQTQPSGFPAHLLSDLPEGTLGKILRETNGGVGMPAYFLTPSYVKHAHASKLKVFVYSIDSLAKVKQAIDQCAPDIIFTNQSSLFSSEPA